MSLKVFYTSIHGFLPYQLSLPSIHTTFSFIYEKHETSKRTLWYMLKAIVRDTTKPLLKQF